MDKSSLSLDSRQFKFEYNSTLLRSAGNLFASGGIGDIFRVFKDFKGFSSD